MPAIDRIATFVKDRIGLLAADYKWKINTAKLPVAYAVGGGDAVSENLKLRNHLHALVAAQHPRRDEICTWYVESWGGVRGNNERTMAGYLQATDAALIAKGADGISTWSKILCLRDPRAYAIFDCRVAVALAILQSELPAADRIAFPILKGKTRSNLIRAAQMELDLAPVDADFYRSYNALLEDVAARSVPGGDIQIAEMVLFANAPDLCIRYLAGRSPREARAEA